MQENKVTVYNKENPIFRVILTDSGKLLKAEEIINIMLMPICLHRNYCEETVQKWMDSRSIPEKRVGKVRTEKLFSPPDIRHGMFSLSDQYWFQWDESETWEKGNFFSNRYDTDYGRMYFTPWNVKKKNLEKESPDRTTNGVLPKRWMQPDENECTSYLIKSGNRAAHQEPISEVLSSMTLAALDIIPYVEYELVIDGLQICSRCRNFITENTEFVPASHIYRAVPVKDGETPFEHIIAACKEFGIEDAEDYLLRMVTADYLISNNDRHLGNFGFIRSAETGELLSFAPLFDSGSAFFGNANRDRKRSRIFNGLEEKALSYTIRKCHLTNKYKYTDLLDVIEMYPLLTGAEKNRIHEQIDLVYEHLNENIRIVCSGKGA